MVKILLFQKSYLGQMLPKIMKFPNNQCLDMFKLGMQVID